MSAYEVTDAVIKELNKGIYDMVILNFANADMVGHTGDMKAAVKAVETVDTCVGKITDLLLEHGGQALIIADHGNAEKWRIRLRVLPIRRILPIMYLVFLSAKNIKRLIYMTGSWLM